MCNFYIYLRSSGKSRTYFAPLLGKLCSASAASIQARSYACDYSKWMWLNSRGFSWSFYQGQRIIKLPVMRTVWKYAHVTESGLAVPLGYSPACCERIQTLDLPLEFLWGSDRAQANAPVRLLYLLPNTCSRDFVVGLLNLCPGFTIPSYLVSVFPLLRLILNSHLIL